MDSVESKEEPWPGGPPVGAVLAGGAGSRIGGSKALVQLGGQALISYPLRAIVDAGLEPLVVAKADTELPDLDVAVERAEPNDRHPLHGVVAALRAARGRPVVVVACDTPLVSAELLAWLAGFHATAVPRVGGVLQPLLARYNASAEPALRDSVRAGVSAQAAALALQPRLIGETELAAFGRPEHLFLNVNDERDLLRAASLLGGSPCGHC
ncbi:MAG: molybdenum cofactor guanylyltransferase [Solirubrobacteraceae bacterium]